MFITDMCLLRLGSTPTTRFCMQDMQIRGTQPSSAYYRRAVNLTEMLDQCCLELILSSMNTMLGHRGNREFKFHPQQCRMRCKVIYLYLILKKKKRWLEMYIHWRGLLLRSTWLLWLFKMDVAHSGLQDKRSMQEFYRYPTVRYWFYFTFCSKLLTIFLCFLLLVCSYCYLVFVTVEVQFEIENLGKCVNYNLG